MATKVSASTSVGNSGSPSDLNLDPKGFLSGSVKKYIATTLCIGVAIATREALGFENTAIAVTAISTVFGFILFGFSPLIIPFNQKFKESPAIIGGAAGFTVSLVALAALESSFQMFQIIRGYIG